jgi:RimJ/RimL family protein N-acetyltransferase
MADKKPAYPTLPALIGDNVFLRPATAEDIANTYHWLLLSDPQSLSAKALPFRTASEAAEAFRKQERSAFREQLMIVKKKDKTVIGWVKFSDVNAHNRSAAFEIVIDPDQRKKGYASEATELLEDYLFDYRGLNKIYTQTPEYNIAGIELLEKSGFKRDGTLRRHYFHKNEFHDGYLYSLLRFEGKK